MKKEQFISLEIEIEKKLNVIETKNVIPAEIDTLQDARILFDGDAVNGEPISLLTEQVDSVHVNEEIEYTHSSDSGEESSAESTAEEKNVKYGG